MIKMLFLVFCEFALFLDGYKFKQAVEEKSNIGVVFIIFLALCAGFALITKALGIRI